MNTHLYIGSQDGDALWDCGSVLTKASWSTSITDGQPGKLAFTLMEDDSGFEPDNGNQVRFDVDGITVFLGYIFTITPHDNDGRIDIVAYDQMRYLKNPGHYVFANRKGDEVFRALCADNGLTVGTVDACDYSHPLRVCDGKSAFDILEDCINDELTSKGKYFCLYDDAGKLCWRDLENMRTDLEIGDESLLQDYDYEKSIDQDTFDSVTVAQEDGDKTSRVTESVKSDTLIKKWGKLALLESTQNLTKSAMKERAAMLLKLMGRPTEKLSLKCVGYPGIRAGNGIVVNITKRGILGYYVILSCAHTYEDDLHSMDLDMVYSGEYTDV